MVLTRSKFARLVDVEEGHCLALTAKRMVSLLTDFTQSTQTIIENNDTITNNHKHSIPIENFCRNQAMGGR